MKTAVLNGKPKVLVLSGEELGQVFGSLRRVERIKQRIFQLNRLGERFGIRLGFSSVDGTLTVRAQSTQSAQKLTERLIQAKGHIQRGLGELLLHKLEEFSEPLAWSQDFLESQIHRWQVLAAERSGEVWVEPAWTGAQRAPGAPRVPDLRTGAPDSVPENFDELIKALAQEPPRMMILGSSARGKTSLLWNCFMRAVRQWQAGGRYLPLFIPAAYLNFRDGETPAQTLASVLGAPERSRDLESYWQNGRLFVFIDGLDENPQSFQRKDPCVVDFWQGLDRQRFLCSSREDFWKAAGGFPVPEIPTVHLAGWRADHVQRYCAQLSQREEGSALGHGRHLAKLSPDQWKRLLGPGPYAPLEIQSFARQFLTRGRFPKNPSESLERNLLASLQWESSKPWGLDPQLALGVLRSITKRAKKKGGNRFLSFEAAWKQVQGRFPFLEDPPHFFRYLANLSFIRLDYAAGSLEIKEAAASVLSASSS